MPPQWMLDMALQYDIGVMAGLPWQQHVAFLDEKDRAGAIVERIRQAVRDCGGHPAILCYAIGNEIPASIVRWHGRKRVEKFLFTLYDAAKQQDPEGIVTYGCEPGFSRATWVHSSCRHSAVRTVCKLLVASRGPLGRKLRAVVDGSGEPRPSRPDTGLVFRC